MLAEIGYQEDPIDGEGIIRSRTTVSIRSWEFDRDLGRLGILNDEFVDQPFPGMYLLFDNNNQYYVGESSNLYERLTTHTNNPPDQLSRWTRAIVVNDGRIANQSDLNDQVLRKSLNFIFLSY